MAFPPLAFSNLFLNWRNVKFGGLAQLGERLAGSQKVIGSNPLSSTKLRLAELFLFLVSSRDALTLATARFPISVLGRVAVPRSSKLLIPTLKRLAVVPLERRVLTRRGAGLRVEAFSFADALRRQKRNCRRASKDATATLTDKFRLRICGRIGMRKPRSGFASQKPSGKPRDSGPKTKTSPRRYSTAS